MDLKKLEKRTAASVFDTGLVDVAVGLTFIITSFAGMFDEYRYYIDALLILPVVLLYLAIRYVAQPRMGMVVLKKERRRRTRNFVIIMTAFMVIMLGFTVWGNGSMFQQLVNPRVIISLIIFLIFSLVAYFYDFRRMYVYAFLVSGAFNLMEYLREVPEYSEYRYFVYLFAAMIITGTGIYLLARFLKENPLNSQQPDYEQG